MTAVRTIRLRVLPRLIPINGKNVELRATATEIQWRNVGDPTWVLLVLLSAITGPQGVPGPAGAGVPAGGTPGQVLGAGDGVTRVWTNVGGGDMLSSQNLSTLASFPTSRKNMSVPTYLSTRTALKALDTTKDTIVTLTEAGREGVFFWNPANLSAQVTQDTREGIYIAPTAAPTGASGAWVRRFDEEILASWFGIVGDDTADDTAAWQVAASFAGGKTLCGELGKTYKLTAELPLQDGCTLSLRKSRLNFRITGSVRCVVPGNNCRVYNGTIKNFGTTTSIAGDYQCPITIGKFTANVPVSNVHCLNLQIESDWTEGNGIFITGASNNILIENIKFPDSPMFSPICAHWGGTAAGTGHPYNITIRNIDCGNINANGFLISLASAYDVLVENVKGGTCYYGFHNYAGDFTNMYAPAAIKPLIGKNITVRNMMATDVRNSGIWVNGQTYNPALTTPTATPIALSCLVENCTFIGVGGIAQSPEPAAPYAANLANCRDVELRNNRFEWFQNGITPTDATEQVRIIGNTIRSCSYNAIYVSLASSAPIDWHVEGNACQLNNRSGSTNDFGAAIFVGISRNARILNNRIGLETGEFSYFGVRVFASATTPVIEGNYVRTLAASGVAYSIGAATSYDINATGGNNRAFAGITLNGGTTLFTVLRGLRIGVAVEGSSPSAGTWAAGDRLYSTAPTATVVGYVCTAAGTPGTWRPFGT